ncbi:amino acid adenylation domain-containing protein/thioester reductase-like protein [Kibdelosporangium banguiense]|uniref:Amino acid adenylation domain-containing protein/thioester reductase-like protein n=1 Tax=Kibdelosporangium banguiense TaxID=1365924 RepID=A0ABS4TYC1_9PSEU|nr:non-ribosomal peptide synthetase [Kibdelosporangium banguiense]MBP2329401.1 amino acid adenylation domain-containing protein/thioester reductase-like protein [Kibdelosporangium banguiense]
MTTVDNRSSFSGALQLAIARHGAVAAEPLSAEQRRLWLLGGISGARWATVLGRYHTAAPVDPAEIQLRLGEAAARHEALRSVFTTVQGRPVRLVLPTIDTAFRLADLSATDSHSRTHITTALNEPFSVEHGPLLRVLLLQAGDHSEIVLVGLRLVLDETSLNLLAGELLAAPGSAGGPPLSTVIEAGEARLRQPDVAGRVAEWGRWLSAPAATEIPGERQRPAIKNMETGSVVVTLPHNSQQTTDDWTATATAAWLGLLMRYQATTEAMTAVRITRPASVSQVVGPLDGIRPVRGSLEPGGALRDLLPAVTQQIRTPTVDVPFAHLLDVVPPRRDVSRAPYVQTLVHVAGDNDSGIISVPPGAGTTDYDIELTVWVAESVIRLQLDYDRQLFSEDQVRTIATQFGTLLNLLADGPDGVALDSVSLLDEKSAVQAVLAGTGDRVPIEAVSLLDVFRRQAGRTPDNPAVRMGEQTLTYAEFGTRVQLIAAELVRRGVEPGHRVAVWLRRSPDAIAGFLGVLAAGAAFVPVDPAHPEDRVRYLLDDSDPALVLTETAVHAAHAVGDVGKPVVLIDQLTAAVPEVTLPEPLGEDAAYLIYTSGSTGRPKGALVRHESVVNNVRWRQRQWSLTPSDVVLHNHAFSFDPSVWAIFWPLSTGACVELASEQDMNDPSALVRVVRDGKVTVIGGVPSLLGLLLDHPAAGECTQVRLVLSGAEPLTPALLNRIAATWSAQAANLYGPTEATIDAAAYRIPADEYPVPVPIGRPVDNAGMHVVDPALQPVPAGIPGEIVITGAGLATGYHRRPSLTAARFLPDPFSGVTGARLYRTGDLGRRLRDGTVQFLGRVDDQVKIRGHRIELPEVENAVRVAADGAETVVVALDAGTERARLAAAVVTTRHTVEDLRTALRAELPEYMIPERVHLVSELPRTPTGKVDRLGLARQLAETSSPHEVRTAPRTELEQSVADAFRRVLRMDQLDVHADFFELGGTSMMIARLSETLSAQHDVQIPLHEFFQTPTVAGVAETISVYRRDGLSGVLARRHAAMLEADGTLDDAITPEGLPRADWRDPSRVLLTGATGYLGLHLVEQLLRRTAAEVVCLCRADDEEHALQRLREGFALYEISVEDQLHRVRCVVGDLAGPLLGLPQQVWDELAGTVDVIYHNGALVNFVYPYSALKAPNVTGTQRIIELACTTRLKAVHYISTIDTLLATHSPRPFLENDAPLHSAVGVPAGYTGSKWVAEKVVDAARRRGIPVTVFRPGLILGHTATGAVQTIDYLLVAMRGFLPMKILPEYPRIFDIVPVDYVAAAVVHISREPEALGEFFHLFNPAPVPLSTFCDWVASYGYEFDIVPFAEGRRRALGTEPGHPLYPLVPLIRDADPEPHRALDPRHANEVEPARECAGTLRLLAGSGIGCPPTTEQAAHDVLDYLVRIGFLPAPAAIAAE